jgi:hypothetical protein
MLRALTYTGREILMDSPLMSWVKDKEDFFSNLIKDSIGGVDEEEIQTTSIAYHSAQRSWRHYVAEERNIHYGIRPFRQNPYAYISYELKDRDGDKIFFVNLRYYSPIVSKNIVELLIALTLPHSTTLNMGARYDISKHNHIEPVLNLHKDLGKNRELFMHGNHSLLMVG